MDRVLIVDDYGAGREIVARALETAGFSISFAAVGREALDLLDDERPDVIVTDHHRPDVDAIDFVRRVRMVSDVPVVVLTAFGSIPECERAMREGASRFLQFRRDVDRLGSVARELIESGAPRRFGRERREKRTAEQARALRQGAMRERLQRLVVECDGNLAEIARRIGRDRSTVRYHLRRMGRLD
jgi:DNA-binding NtrC family response regulator